MNENKKTHKIYDFLLTAIKENKFIENYKLPSENQLAEKFDASRMCAQLAYSKLEKERLVVKIKGSGHYINTEFILSHTNTHNLIEAKIAVLGPVPLSKFLAEIYNTINTSFMQNGLSPSFFFSNADIEDEMLEMLVSKHFDAIIFYPEYGKNAGKVLTELINNKFPIVLIDRYYKDLNAYTVSSNHFASSYKIVEYFYNKGRKKILFISEPPIYTSIKHRFNGYKTALSHFPVLELKSKDLLFDSTAIDQFNQTLSLYLKNREFDAIITSSGGLADRVLSNITQYDIKIGKDILLALYDEEVSFDNIINFPYIKLVQNTAAIGETATKIIIDLLKRKPIPSYTHKIPTVLKEINTPH